MPAPSDLIHEVSTTTGTGSFTLSNVNGKRSFNTGFGTGGTDLFDYYISNRDAAEWERGTGHLSASTTLVRDTVIASSNANAAVNFSAGTKDVVNDVPAGNQVRNENSTVTDGHAVLFDGTTGRKLKSAGASPYVVGGSDVALSDGGTGSSTVAGARTNLGLLPGAAGGRLTLTSNTPVLTATVSAATTVYYTPYLHRFVPIYDGTNFMMLDVGAELSQATTDTTKSPAAVTTNSNYDLFVWSDSGTYRCTRGPAWTSSTARGTGAATTELERVQGVYVNKIAITNGPAAQRGTYVGTVRSNGSSQIDYIFGALASGGTAGFFGVWNMYNRVDVATMVRDSADSWTYQTRTWRAPNGSATMRVSFVRGLDEDGIDAEYYSNAQVGALSDLCVGVGLDSTTAFSGFTAYNNNGGFSNINVAKYAGLPGLGFHYVSALETVLTTTNAATFFGDSGLAEIQSGFAVMLRQ